MSSTSVSPNFARQRVRKRALQHLRREAGYRSAKDFAEQVGIPGSTYARYERAVEDPDCGISPFSAWQIADALSNNIDLVVGSEDINAHGAAAIDKCVSTLSLANQLVLTGFLVYFRSLEATKSAAGEVAW